jgi:HEAT repeat protein
LSDAGKSALLAAMKDDDGRVRANAVEALGHCRESEACAAVEPLVHSSNNRVRANAVDALLKWKVNMAGQAIRDMCEDFRPRHRVSARWVLEKNQNIVRQLRVGSEQKGANVSVAV